MPVNKHSPKISVGLPVFNGELFIKKSIESILSQTYSNFELVISDNASTDLTEQICKSFDDPRIKYVRQKNNLGIHRNYKFLLDDAKYTYFIWVSSDDYWHPNYLEKNLEILMNNPKIVSCVGIVKPFSAKEMGIKSELIETARYPKFISEFIRNRRHDKMTDTESISGTFNKKTRKFLKITKSLRRWWGLHRTEQLRKSYVFPPFINVEVSTFLNLLKLGDFYECNETFLYEFDEGISSRGIINTIKVSEHKFPGTVFPFQPFTKWFLKNLGIKLFLKNLDIIILMNLGGQFALFVDLYIQSKQ